MSIKRTIRGVGLSLGLLAGAEAPSFAEAPPKPGAGEVELGSTAKQANQKMDALVKLKTTRNQRYEDAAKIFGDLDERMSKLKKKKNLKQAEETELKALEIKVAEARSQVDQILDREPAEAQKTVEAILATRKGWTDDEAKSIYKKIVAGLHYGHGLFDQGIFVEIMDKPFAEELFRDFLQGIEEDAAFEFVAQAFFRLPIDKIPSWAKQIAETAVIKTVDGVEGKPADWVKEHCRLLLKKIGSERAAALVKSHPKIKQFAEMPNVEKPGIFRE